MIRLKTEYINIGYEENLIIKDLNVEIPDKKITTIIGPNGCGKSTLLKAITRIISSKSGNIILDGKDMMKMDTKSLAKKISILPQTHGQIGGISVRELVSYGRFPYQKGFGRLSNKDKEIIDWALDVTGTMIYKNRSIDALSGGQRQRVWIAMALAQETDIIFLDEPTTYLDMAHQLEILELLQKLNIEQHRTVVMVLHDLNQAARFANYIIALKNGKIIKAGNSEEVINKKVLKEVFNIDAEIGIDPRTKKPICTTYNLIKGDKENEKNTYSNVNNDYIN